jgi:hypothetical protein
LRKRDFVTIDVPGAAETLLDNGGINSRGDIVASYCDTAPCTSASSDVHGFLLSRGDFTTIDIPVNQPANAFAINARGEIVGGYGSGSDVHGFFLSSGETDNLIPCDAPFMSANAQIIQKCRRNPN